MTIRVVIVEDEAQTREALKKSVDAEMDMNVIGAAKTFQEGKSLVASVSFEVLLVDLGLGTESGIQLIDLCRQSSNATILVVSSLADEHSLISAVEMGADGYILKDGHFSTIGVQIRQALSGEAPISPAVARHLLKRFKAQAVSNDMKPSVDPYGLSDRELQVLEALAQGYRYKEISDRLNLSYHTIADYAKTLYRKMRVNSRNQAIVQASKDGLIRMPAG